MSRNDRGCPVHDGAIHGGEAEELRADIETLIGHGPYVTSSDLQCLLDRINARDSLAYLEHTDKVTQLPRYSTERERAATQECAAALKAARPRSADAPPDDEHLQDLASHGSNIMAVHHGLDTNDTVCFYEQEFYPLSNFSAFTLEWKGYRFDTSEAAYHWEKFTGPSNGFARFAIRTAASAHSAFQISRSFKEHKRADWDDVKINVMRDILRAKVAQHPYVRKKLLETGVRRLVENSWRDDFWGWGERGDGKNTLGVLWMEVRSEVQAATAGLPVSVAPAEIESSQTKDRSEPVIQTLETFEKNTAPKAFKRSPR